jgi:hypothetical protein
LTDDPDEVDELEVTEDGDEDAVVVEEIEEGVEDDDDDTEELAVEEEGAVVKDIVATDDEVDLPDKEYTAPIPAIIITTTTTITTIALLIPETLTFMRRKCPQSEAALCLLISTLPEYRKQALWEFGDINISNIIFSFMKIISLQTDRRRPSNLQDYSK